MSNARSHAKGLCYPVTPDGRYFVAKGVLWRCTNPGLSEEERKVHVSSLMRARRAVRDANTAEETKAARAAVNEAKLALGERGPVWWTDGAPDHDRRAPKNTPYAEWWADTEGRGGSSRSPQVRP